MEGSQESSTHPTSQETTERPGVHHHTEKSWLQKIKDKFLPGVRISLLISLIFYIAMFIVGIWGIHKCPVEEYIPFFLIITGGIGALSKVVSIIREAILKHYPVQYVESSCYSVELVFLLLGTFWVFKEYKPHFSPDPDRSLYCNKTVYLFAFTYLVVFYSIIGLVLICFGCFLGCLYFVKGTERANRDPDSPTQPIRVSRDSEQQA